MYGDDLHGLRGLSQFPIKLRRHFREERPQKSVGFALLKGHQGPTGGMVGGESCVDASAANQCPSHGDSCNAPKQIENEGSSDEYIYIYSIYIYTYIYIYGTSPPSTQVWWPTFRLQNVQNPLILKTGCEHICATSVMLLHILCG